MAESTNERNTSNRRRRAKPSQLSKVYAAAIDLSRNEKIDLAKSLCGATGLGWYWLRDERQNQLASRARNQSDGGKASTQGGGRKAKRKSKTKKKQAKQATSKWARYPEFVRMREARAALRKAKKNKGISKTDLNDLRIEKEIDEHSAASQAWFLLKKTIQASELAAEDDGGGGAEARLADAALPARSRVTEVLTTLKARGINMTRKEIRDHLAQQDGVIEKLLGK